MFIAAPQSTVYQAQRPNGLVIWRYAGNEYEADCSEFNRIFYQPDKNAFTVDVDGQQAWVPLAGVPRMSLVRLVRLAEYFHGETPAIHPQHLMRYFDPRPNILHNRGQYKVRSQTDWMIQDALVDWLIAEMESKGDRPDSPYFDLLQQIGVEIQVRRGQVSTTYRLIQNGNPLTDWLKQEQIIRFAIGHWGEVAMLNVYLGYSPEARAIFWQQMSVFLDFVQVPESISQAVYGLSGNA